MLSKQNRVSGQSIALLFKNAKPTGTPFFVARYGNAAQNPQFAIIVPKTIAKTATARNSSRRKWYGSLRTVLKTLTPKNGMYAFILKKEGLELPPKEREKALISYLNH